MNRMDAIEARLAARSDGAHVAYESDFGCGGYLLKEPGDEEFFAHAPTDMETLLAVARAVEDYWECDQRSGLPKGVSVKEYQAKRAALFAALEPLLEGE